MSSYDQDKTPSFSDAAIYVGTYGAYNNGNLQGAWLNLSDYDSSEEFYQACKDLHPQESDPEFMFQDWEHIPASLIEESYISPVIWDLLEADIDPEIVKILNDECVEPEKWVEQAENVFLYEDSTPDSLLYQLSEDFMIFGELDLSTIWGVIDNDALEVKISIEYDINFYDFGFKAYHIAW